MARMAERRVVQVLARVVLVGAQKAVLAEAEVLGVQQVEFGRRIAENASGGTDHGAGAPVLLLGAPVRGGVHGAAPDLGGDGQGDVPVTLDFRHLYAAALEWLQVPSSRVLPAAFEPASAFRG